MLQSISNFVTLSGSHIHFNTLFGLLVILSITLMIVMATDTSVMHNTW